MWTEKSIGWKVSKTVTKVTKISVGQNHKIRIMTAKKIQIMKLTTELKSRWWEPGHPKTESRRAKKDENNSKKIR